MSLFDSQLFLGWHKRVSVLIASDRFLHNNVQVSIEWTSFFLVFRLKEKNVYVQVFIMVKIPVFAMTHVSELICCCRTAVSSFVQSIETAWCHDTNSYSSVHFCNSTGLLLPSVMWTKSFFKGIAVNYLFIPIYTNYTNTQQQQQKEKKHYHDINIVIRDDLKKKIPGLPISLGWIKYIVIEYCCFDSISSRTDAF